MESVEEFAETRKNHPFRVGQAIRLGITLKQLRSQKFRHVLYGVYVPEEVADSVRMRCWAATLALPPAAVFCGVTAARLHEVPVPDHDRHVHAAVPSTSSTVPRIKGLKVHSYTIDPLHLRELEGLRTVGPERLFLELAAALPRLDLIVAGDHMLKRGLTTRTRLAEFLVHCYRRRGVRKARNALPHLDGGSDSPPETKLRMLIVDAGLPRPAVNRDVFGPRGEWLARPDLSYPELKIAIEYEGLHHQQEYEQYSRDIERDGRLIDDGWIVIRVNKDGLFRNPTGIVNRVRKALAQRTR